ncbi:ROK family protein [Nonomuraea sp. NPDC050556]|uniref:ROK family protein n=1 Tax=Nonomuraea sp. NPDC050556 TaxID=3364369 RepID=UPI00379E128B
MILAIDIGGTKLAAGLVSDDGALVTSRRVATPQSGDAEDLWTALTDLIEPLAAGVDGVGVGCGGPMVWPSGEVSPLNIPAWRGFPVRSRLQALFPGLPVRLHNDAICVAAAEHWRGAGQGSANMLGMVVSTGVGGGLILGDRLIDGGTGNAGHIGHVIVEPGGVPCGCGGRGCLEAVARGPGLVEWALAHGWTPGERTSSEARPYREDREVTARDLAADARAGDAVATAAMRRAGRALGIAIASATHLCDLDVVTIGGGLAQTGDLLFDPLEEALREHARMDFAKRVKVVPAALGQDAGLVGGAALILAEERYWLGHPPVGVERR